jgi:adenylate kinase
MSNVVLMAGPGIELASVAGVLAGAVGLQVVSPGDVFREHVQRRTPFGEEAARYMDAGELVPDELIAKALADVLAGADGGWLMYNFPRTVGQAELLTRLGHVPDIVVELALTEDELGLAVRRLVDRRIALDPDEIGRREDLLFMYSLYQENHQERVEPLRAYYGTCGKFRVASGFGAYEDVAARLVPIVLDSQGKP